MSTRSSAILFLAAIAGAGARLLAANAAEAAISPPRSAQSTGAEIQLAWCGLGFRLGPLGACLAGEPGPGYYAGPAYPGRACPPGYRLGPYGRRCWPS